MTGIAGQSVTAVADLPQRFQDALDPEQVTRIWQTEPESHFHWLGLASVVACELLRLKKNKRCLIRFTCWKHDGGEVQVLGKIRFKGLDRRSSETAKQLRDAGFSESGPWQVPQSLGSIERWNLSLQTYLPSTTLNPTNRYFVDSAETVGRCLAGLHRSGCKSQRTHDFADEIAHLQQRLERMPPGAQRNRLAAIVDDCQALTPRSSAPPTLVHRDFYFDQVLRLDSGKLAIIDWDLAAMSDSALDVGNYLAHLTEFGLRCPNLNSICEQAGKAFLQGYLRSNPAITEPEIAVWHYVSLVRHLFLARILPGRSHTIPALFQRLARERKNLEKFGGPPARMGLY